MIKVSTVVCCASLIAAVILVKPNVDECMDIYSDIKNLKSATGSIQVENEKAKELLGNYEEKYQDLVFKSNLDIAKAVDKLSSSKLISIKSIAEMNDKEIECAEVSSIEDVSFFNSETKKMLFQLRISDYSKFMDSLRESGLVVNELTFDFEEKSAVLSINSVFSPEESEDVSSDNEKATTSDAEDGIQDGVYDKEPEVEGAEG